MATKNTTTLPEAPIDSDNAVGWCYDAGMELHKGEGSHVECPKRITTIRDTLETQGLSKRCYRIPSRKAEDAELLRCHPKKHIEHIDKIFDRAIAEGGLPDPHYVDGKLVYDGHIDIHDVSIFANKDTAKAARLSAGCVVQATRSVVNGSLTAALAVVRPPGHHAECERAMGFCFFSNCAVAARDALALSPNTIKKVMVLDWDVHHGNGIQDCLYDDPNVLYISLHRDPSNFYPFVAGFMTEVGKEGSKGEGFNINLPWPTRGVGDLDYQAAFETIVEPVVRSYSPDLIIVAAGFDAAEGDPLGGCLVSPDGYAWMTRRLQSLCPKMVLALEGGYNNRVTAECVCACLRVLLGESELDSKAQEGEEEVEDLFAGQKKEKTLLPSTRLMLEQVSALQIKYWPVLEGFEEKWEAMVERQKNPGIIIKGEEERKRADQLASILGEMRVNVDKI